jgi:hypothetical protein
MLVGDVEQAQPTPPSCPPTERPLLAERIQRNPILRFLGSLMVGQAMWRRNALGEGSVAPTLSFSHQIQSNQRSAPTTMTTQPAPTKMGLVERIVSRTRRPSVPSHNQRSGVIPSGD